MKSIFYFILLSTVSTIPFVSFSQSKTEPADILDDYVISAMKDWEVPGLALTIVKDNEIVFSRGYGLTELGKPGTVNRKTLFAAASTTKAFTAAALGILVDQKKIKWDDPVIKHLPEFKLNDPWVTQELSIRDLLTHRAGLGNTDLLWMVNYPTEEILYRMRYAELRHAIMYKTIDLYLDNDNSHDWHKEIFELYKGLRIKSEMEKKKLAAERIPETNPNLHPEGYEGIFSDPLWGEIEIKLEDNRLTFSYNSHLKGILKHWHYDTFEVIWNKKQMGSNLLTFGFDNKGKVAEIRIFNHAFREMKNE